MNPRSRATEQDTDGSRHARTGFRSRARIGSRTIALAAWLTLVAGSVTMTRAADAPAALSMTAVSKAAIANGRQVYMTVGCWQCHGTVGQGGAAGPRLAPGPMPREALRVFLRNSVRAMPAYPTTILSDASIDDLHAYLQSIVAAPLAETLPLLRGLK